jgi:hypothetical protein
LTSFHCTFHHARVPDPIWDKVSGLDALAAMFATALVGTSRSAALACLIGITLAAPEAIPRRDNVAATIAILQERLSKTELLISTGIGSVPDQLLAA